MAGDDTRASRFRQFARACGLASLGLGTLALAGWAARQPVLMGLRESYIPMAPNTAVGFAVLGTGLVAVATVGGWRRARDLAGAGALGIALICLLRLAEYAAGTNYAVDSWFMREPGRNLGGVPLGKMALFTAIAFLGASVSLANLAWSRRGEKAAEPSSWAVRGPRLPGRSAWSSPWATCSAPTHRCSTAPSRSRWR